ncbi:MAG: DNA/RNA non-specific endonuclease [Betaproteobacteria bacterium]|nr:DNA/RNA non-specific endonuclease [Betaproteobacteria bacterium]NBO43324.1 DNA/RNA non-specific endonuclease [Betaproteobacteria bacterium]NBP09772.1 DNA/RNA non-specific endonuclease [Betaproteobacteria bacterium]NBP61165.1 DNA/RNA non-specific endonuclease [Betaproteobacteria bacterium]NBQ10278.1 DNA/RNA non-specific endonuclease [Betaproteobacteria bacterium]
MLLTIDSRRTPTLRALPKPKRIVKGKPVAALLGRIVSLAASWAVLCTASSLASEKAAPNNAMVVLQQDKPQSADRQAGYFQPRFSACRQHFPNGEPPRMATGRSPGNLRELCFEAFAILHSGQTKTPVWVAQRLDPEELAKAQQLPRSGRFYPEARLPFAERASLEDYQGSGWDRGHMAPAGDMASEIAMAQSFSLANMVPQAPELNRNVWADYEKSTRRYVRRVGHAVYVFTGPVYADFDPESSKSAAESSTKRLGKGGVWVPRAIFKLVYDPISQRAWAYWSDNQNDTKAAAPISLRLLQQRLGHQWLPGVSDDSLLHSKD